MPKNPAKIIQTVAPGPPIAIATATPAILPKPTVADKAAVNAWKCVTSPTTPSALTVSKISPPGVTSPAISSTELWSTSSYLPLVVLMATPNKVMLENLKYNVKKKAPESSKITTIGTSIPAIEMG